MGRFTRFETIAERLVEGTFARLFAGRLEPREVGLHLARAIEDHEVVSPEGLHQAPTHYSVYIHPVDLAALAADRPALEGELAGYLAELAAQADTLLSTRPTVKVLGDAGLEPRQVRVDAHWVSTDSADLERTQEMASPGLSGRSVTWERLCRPYLILDGRRHVELTQPVISIGRALENDIVIEDARVSRRHAQLRRRFERYVVYDLGSRGGTQINGYPIGECVLQSGDVISLAGVEVIYGEDAPASVPPPSPDDTPTLALPLSSDT